MTSNDDLRAALDLLDKGAHLPPRPTQYRRGFARGQEAAASAIRAALATTEQREGLDVERLATAIHAGEREADPSDRAYCPACMDDARRYAREYAALTIPEPETA
jgi:hypothetical protein